MESDSKDNKHDEDSSSKYILDYYRKYSQNRELPKYFSGTSVAYLPVIVDDEEKPKSSTNINIEVSNENQQEKMQDAAEFDLSPGSVASNRKLEWDNLADIGYDNAKTINKCSSLPILPQFDKEPSKHTSSDSSNVKVIIYPYSSSEEKSTHYTIESSSSSSPVDKKVHTSSSATLSSATKEKITNSDLSSSEEKILSFKHKLDYLKSKIGLPAAHSTPCEAKSEQFEKICDTPVIRTEKHAKKLMKKSSIVEKDINVQVTNNNQTQEIKLRSTDAKMKVVNLCLTKPLLLDCVSKAIKTKQLTVGIQTDSIPKPKVKDTSQQIITIYKHSDSEKASTETAKSTISNAIASNCDSFEYFKNNMDEPVVSLDNKPNKNISKTIEKQEKSDSSQEIKSTANISKTSVNDIERNIYVLQKLMRSKKYDSSSKKRYIKKILQKLLESRYFEDSSTSSELFYPKTDPSRILQEQIKNSSFKNEESSSSYQSHEDQKLSPTKRKLEITKTQNTNKDAKGGCSKSMESTYLSPSKKTTPLELTTHLTKGLSGTNDSKDMRKGPFTLTTKILEPTSEKSSLEKKSLSSSSTSKSYENWKESQTNSELVFESNSKCVVGDGDHLIINFADKERQYQLNWIDREINHLGKLKSLLQKPRIPFEQGENVKTTSVYMVTGGVNDKNMNPKRKYVIETDLGVKGTQPHNFRLNGENYVVVEAGDKKTETGRPTVADIEVMSDSRTTNIKVKTFCSVCKKTPCICNSVLDQLYSKNDTHKYVKPTSSATLSGKYSGKKNHTPTGTFCLLCLNSPCLCNDNNYQETESSKCSICQMSPCACHCEPKNPVVPVKGYITCPHKEENEVCLCDLISTDETSSSSSSKENQHGSLGKIFINCKCEEDCECNCDFVNKLLKHFSKQEVTKSKSNLQNNEAQVTLCGNEATVQTERRKEMNSTQAVIPAKDSEAQTLKYAEVNVGTEKSQNINNINIVIDNKIPNDDTETYGTMTNNEHAEMNVGTRKLENLDIQIQTSLESETMTEQDLTDQSTSFKSPVDKGVTHKPYLINNEAQAVGNEYGTQTRKKKSDSTQVALPKDYDVQTHTYSEVNVETDKAENINSVNILIDNKKDKNKIEKSTSVKDENEEKKYLPDDLYNLISRIEQALVDKNILSKPKVRTRKSSKTDKFTMCVPENALVVQCGDDKPLQVDQGTMYSSENTPRNQATSYFPPVVSVDQGTTYSETEPCDCSTDYSPPVVDQSTFMSPTTIEKGIPEKISLDQMTNYEPPVVDESTTYKPDKYLVDKGTVPEKIKLSQGTSYNVSDKTQVDQCLCYDPPEVDKSTEYQSQESKNDKGTVKLQVSKDVKSVDMSFCLCASKKNSDKPDSNEEIPDKKKKRHKKSCPCDCKHCTSSKSSSSNSTSRGDSNKVCRCACKCGFIKKGHNCCCKKKPNESSTINEDPTSGTLSTNTTDSTPVLVCSLCHRNTPYDKVSVLRTNTEEYAVCSECMEKRPILTSVCYVGPETETYTHPSSDTVEDGFRRTESHCTCPKSLTNKNKKFQYCPHCKNQLKRTLQSRNGIAYTLTLEEEVFEKSRNRKSKKKSKLKEIKVKVPCPYNRKQVKNEENVHKKDVSRIKRLESGEESETDANRDSGSGNKIDTNFATTETNKKTTEKKNMDKDYTLQEHLKKNRPDFIDSAEYRRQAVLNNKVEREYNKDDMKLRFLEKVENNNGLKSQNRLFSEQQMKEITRRNYKKLPEVQQKAHILRLQKLRSADRFITDMFKTKIRNCILKGKSSFPIDTNIVNYYK